MASPLRIESLTPDNPGRTCLFSPPALARKQAEITTRFNAYTDIMRDVGEKYGAFPHWAKIELPDSADGTCERVGWPRLLG